ncbi:hypothetical protein [Caldalkalibacillus salinus]|uniref:hypothetical protein n=1 Tax=Caldalkalibacillus salinus TaxID=2803787 RepID=UPI001924E507|nr:hypothetical protein [Caldalkalibacillus salinus]
MSVLALETKLLELLEQAYHLTTMNIKAVKLGRVYEIRALGSEQTYIVKFFPSEENLLWQAKCLEHFLQRGMTGIVPFIPNENEAYCTPFNQQFIAVAPKVEGRPVNPAQMDEVMDGIELLADFHKQAKVTPVSPIAPKMSSLENQWVHRVTQANKFLESNEGRDGFVKDLIPYVEEALAWGTWVLQCVPSHNLRGVEAEASRKGQVAHLDVLTPNLLVQRHRHYYLIDYDRMANATELLDIAQYMTSILDHYGWCKDIADAFVSRYMSINPLSVNQLIILQLMLCFPHDIFREWKGLWNTHVTFHPQQLVEQSQQLYQNWEKRRLFVHQYQTQYLQHRFFLKR